MGITAESRSVGRVVSDSIKYVTGQVFPALINFIGVMVYTRIFTPENYGNYALALSLVVVSFAFTIEWIRNSSIRFYPTYRKQGNVKGYFSTLAVVVVASVGVVALIATILFLSFRGNLDPGFSRMIPFAVAYFVAFSLFAISNALLVASFRGWLFTFTLTTNAASKLLFAVLLYHFLGMGAEGIFVGVSLSCILLTPFILKRVGFSFSFKNFSREIAGEMTRFGTPLILMLVSNWAFLHINRVIIKLLGSSELVGYYTVGFQFSQNLLSLALSGFYIASYPVIFHAYEENQNIGRIIYGLTKRFILLAFPFISFVAFFSKELLRLFAGKEFFTGWQVMPLLAFAALFHGSSQYLVKGFEAVRRSKELGGIYLFSATIFTLLSVILTSHYGIKGAAAAALIGYIILYTSLFLRLKRQAHLIFPAIPILKGAVYSGVSLVPIQFMMKVVNGPLPSLILAGVVFLIVYFGILIITGEFRFRTLISFVRKKLLRRSE